MRFVRKTFPFPGLFPALLVLLPLPRAQEPASLPPPARVERRLGLMGTTLTLGVAAAGRPQALAASEAAVEALEAAEIRLSTWRSDSELARLNSAPAGTSVPLSPILSRELAQAALWWRETAGAFDPGVGALVAAWDLRHGGRMPGDAEIRAALSSGGFRALRLEGRNATRLDPGLLLEEGGFGKGAGLDAAARALKAAGAVQAVLDLGGQILVFGERT
ncbi:MAG: FAD:protein FMN transferase, partial [Planctomycetota bacterium]